MVEMAASAETLSAVSERHAETVDVKVTTDRDSALAEIDGLPADVLCSGYQHPDFLRAWLRHTPHMPVFVTLRAAGCGPVLLPLELVKGHGLAYVGERHANGNFPVGRAADIQALALAGEQAILRALRPLKAHGDAIVLERQLPDYGGIANPFVFEHSRISPNPALSLSLEGGFEAVLSRHSGKRRRKRFRSQERELARLGGYRFVGAVPADEVPETLARCLDLKSRHFKAAGIHDVFADAHVKTFFAELFSQGTRREPPTHVLKSLEADGKVIAINACTIHDDRITVEFSSYDPEYRHLSPGDMLFHLSICDATESGIGIFDFGVGDEPFKRAWCEIETLHHDTVIPLTPRGRLIAAAMSIRCALVRAVKHNKRIWKAVKQLRRQIPILR
ncbi:GNAT family N-acetyltransferase [Oricola sp.]|uniref:GNAT family N-acetyltransferase n=1 Tax=Oricola sp. TaxID=1979950 RepID=UPI0025FBF730|nr:GNAT family N-acetyltransferase [Oricola sp.]MCI5073739.1 GNAT family N-acetyltransferase [Oricola sp.]